MSIKDIFNKEKAFQEEISFPNLFDAKVYPYFGKVDINNKPILPKNQALKIDGKHINLSFVVDAYNELMLELKTNKATIPATSLFHYNKMKVYKSYTYQTQFYTNRLSSVLSSFLVWITPQKKNVKTFSQFYSKLETFLLHGEKRNITLENIIKYDLDMFSTGLVIQFLENSVPKEKFFKDVAFNYINNICSKHNFMIDKQSPSRIIYNLWAAQIKEENYIDVLKYELNMLKDLVFDFYSIFIEEFPYEISKNKCNEYYRVFREKPTKIPLKNTQLVNLYLHLKAREENKSVDNVLIDKLKIELYKMLGARKDGQQLTTLHHLANELNFETYDPIFSNNKFYTFTEYY